jgi:hypothetical protein
MWWLIDFRSAQFIQPDRNLTASGGLKQAF